MTFDSVMHEGRDWPRPVLSPSFLQRLRSLSKWRDECLLAERQGRWRWPYATLGTVLAFGAWTTLSTFLFGLMDGIAVRTGTTADLDVALSETTWIAAGNPYSFAVMVLIGATFGLPILLLALLHGRAWSYAFTFSVPFRRAEFLKGAGAVLIVYSGFQLLDFALDPRSYSLAILPPHYLLWLAVAMAVLLFQTLGEELFFRGYLMRVWGAVLPIRGLVSTLVLLLFTSLHTGNADMSADLATSMVWFVISEALFYWVLFRTRSIAATWGMHWANNLFATLVATVPGYAPDLALVVYTDPAAFAEPSQLAAEPFWTLLLQAAPSALLLLLFLWRRSPFHLTQSEA